MIFREPDLVTESGKLPAEWKAAPPKARANRFMSGGSLLLHQDRENATFANSGLPHAPLLPDPQEPEPLPTRTSPASTHPLGGSAAFEASKQPAPWVPFPSSPLAASPASGAASPASASPEARVVGASSSRSGRAARSLAATLDEVSTEHERKASSGRGKRHHRSARSGGHAEHNPTDRIDEKEPLQRVSTPTLLAAAVPFTTTPVPEAAWTAAQSQRLPAGQRDVMAAAPFPNPPQRLHPPRPPWAGAPAATASAADGSASGSSASRQRSSRARTPDNPLTPPRPTTPGRESGNISIV